jgi:hypothetical protein
MKKIPIGTHIYEFHCDSILLNQIYEEVSTSDKIVWSTKIPSDTIKQTDAVSLQSIPHLGYLDNNREVSYYNTELFNWFDACISEVVEDTIPDTKLTINEVWLNKMKFGQHSNMLHYHRTSIYSGLLYLTTHPASFTNFFPQNDATKIMDNFFNFGNTSYVIDAKKTKDIFLSEPTAGKLLIFPSNLMHNISTHADIKNIRYTLAFNTFCEGLISGIPTSKLSIKVKSVKESYEEFMLLKK